MEHKILKVVCIKNNTLPAKYSSIKNRFLKIGKVYEAIVYAEGSMYYIISSNYFHKSLFITLEEYREKQLNKIL